MYLYTVLAFSSEFVEFVRRHMVTQTGVCTQVKCTLASCSVSASSNGGVIAGLFASTFSWVFFQGGVWMAVEV